MPDGVIDDDFGGISVWHVVQVPTDPCRGSTAEDVGTPVQDLARALVRQRGPSTRPEPVTVDGHPGLALEITIPPDTDLGRCTNGEYTLWRAEPTGDSYYGPTAPGPVNHVWILDVDGTLLVVVAALFPDQTNRVHREQLVIAESVPFAPA